MTEQFAETLVLGLLIYVVIGGLVALVIVTFAGARIDPNLKTAPIQARFLIYWGCAGLWPIFLGKLIAGEKPRDA